MTDNEEVMEDEVYVEFTDEEGNVYTYVQEMIIPVGDDKFALLVGVDNEEEQEHEHEHGCGCGCGCEEDDEDVIIAKIVLNEDGEETYVEPTDEEYDAVQQAYDAMFEDEEE